MLTVYSFFNAFAECVPVSDLWKEAMKLKQGYPDDGFEEMARWTEEGKLWQYPIDNEQGG